MAVKVELNFKKNIHGKVVLQKKDNQVIVGSKALNRICQGKRNKYFYMVGWGCQYYHDSAYHDHYDNQYDNHDLCKR